MQRGDLLIRGTLEDGEIDVIDGYLQLDPSGFNTLVYLSLFGGDKDWWGNAVGDIKLTPGLKVTGPLTSDSLAQLKTDIENVLSFLISDGIADSVFVRVREINRTTIYIEIVITKNRVNTVFKYEKNWSDLLAA